MDQISINTTCCMSCKFGYNLGGLFYGRMRTLLYRGRILPQSYKKITLRTSKNLLLLARAVMFGFENVIAPYMCLLDPRECVNTEHIFIL